MSVVESAVEGQALMEGHSAGMRGANELDRLVLATHVIRRDGRADEDGLCRSCETKGDDECRELQLGQGHLERLRVAEMKDT